MTDLLPPPAPPVTSDETKGRNCWVIGCGGCLGLLLLLFLLVWGFSMWVKTRLTVEPFDPVAISEPEKARAEAKLKALNLLDEHGQPPGEFPWPTEGILLSETEMNYWLSKQDPELADSVRLDFEPGEIRAEVRVGEPGDAKRLQLQGRISLTQTEAGLDIRLLDLKLGSFSLPRSFLDEMAKENLAEEAFSDPETRRQFQEKVEKIEILQDQILFVPKARE